ncbi:MAG: hypothetical protein KME25_11180 [Symplocastrum torsivum CPER-KK1]|jgi:hypothetical protein|uniref:Uncharacterized protein n=1 Tax=Symplocastrum torsivum CPER-KK1 TaxID=450513 RepID=A0A951U9P5_9CYAN|nr:hypothetical protein [Symplocastrum torsivum CPER-KK1]
MLTLIRQIFLWLRSGSLKLLTFGGVLLLIWGTLSPVGTLVWWLEQEVESLGFQKKRPKPLPTKNSSKPEASSINCYIVFLPGVGDFSGNQLTPGEEFFLDRLVQLHPNCAAVSDVFPYSAANESLGGRRVLAPLWRFANQAEGWLEMADVLIKIRNLWRFAISVDERYGSIYNQGIATAIIDRMNAAHPIPLSPEQPLKIILIGTSGGAQVALGATPYLDRWLDTQIIVISVGGVFAGSDGFNAADHIYHLHGRRDWIEDIGKIVFPSRWLWTVGSPINQARRQGDYTVVTTGSHEHDGARGYFGENLAAKGVTYVELTVQEVNQLPVWSVQK